MIGINFLRKTVEIERKARVAERVRRYTARNRETCRARVRAWASTEEAAIQRQAWREKSKEKYRGDHGYSRRAALRRYGLTTVQYESLLADQNGVCASCGDAPPSRDINSKHARLAVDHDHKTGKIRGLLCSPCNQALGLFKDSPELLDKAKQYIGSE